VSHFVALVAVKADNAIAALDAVTEALVPFDENLQLPPYFEADSDDEVARAVEFFKTRPEMAGQGSAPTKPFDWIPEGDLDAFLDWQRQAVGAYMAGDPDLGVRQEDGTLGHMTTWNPKSHWDWYSIGGRWTGMLHVRSGVEVSGLNPPSWMKPIGEGRTVPQPERPLTEQSQAVMGTPGVGGVDENENFSGRADVARVGDIDFEGMRTLAAQTADATYDKYEEATKGLTPPEPWAETLKRRDAGEITIEEARAERHNNPWSQALHQAGLTQFFQDEVKVYGVGRDAYVKNVADQAVSCFAFIDLDGEWQTRGRMGMFGMVDEEESDADWLKRVQSWLTSLPSDVWLAVVDCHT